ncbi:MAG: hypothetical protein H6766_04760 [Candidatus Peribacteria bacterium]|nr:MAG: hypothetical protein H6766_04760 [Candidatus Peribacteria bacterium]
MRKLIKFFGWNAIKVKKEDESFTWKRSSKYKTTDTVIDVDISLSSDDPWVQIRKNNITQWIPYKYFETGQVELLKKEGFKGGYWMIFCNHNSCENDVLENGVHKMITTEDQVHYGDGSLVEDDDHMEEYVCNNCGHKKQGYMDPFIGIISVKDLKKITVTKLSTQ